MLPDPLHPAVVHMPLALAALVPFFIIGAFVAIHRGAPVRKAWGLVAALVVLFSASTWLAVRTGEDQEDRVEEVVDHDIIHEHEERGERLLQFTWVAVAVGLVGLASGKVGLVGRILTAVMAVFMGLAAYASGESGGELVYKHGAANAYIEASGVAPTVDGGETEPHDNGEDR